ncbi:hypothetical protein AB0G64_09295 [Streptomyces longwoodensis]|uniref:hypothetical protein n=1 Tax=Streptomyces longwoodensis TaxID=68231 RepID=UPI0033E13C49
MTGLAPPMGLYGLHVDLGDFHTVRGVWLRRPVATFSCPHGCRAVAVGADEVAEFTARIHADHARSCPGPDRKATHG